MSPTPVTALRRLAAHPVEAAGPDEELLHLFRTHRDEAAFAALVRRHGGLVLDVCRTVLRNEADAEDAFQATFISLAAAAGRVRQPAALAGWLHAVAWRTAGKARRARDRRRAHEARVAPQPEAQPPDPSWAEVRQTVHEEVNRLPDRYRVSIVLFYLAGRTQDEVGRALGLSTAGAKKRLERGRDLLRSALDSRGFGPSAVLAAAAVMLPAPRAGLASTAVELAVRFLTDRGAVPSAVLSLLSTGARPMSIKLAFGAVALLGAAATVGLGGFGGAGDQAGRPDDPPAKTKTAGAEPLRKVPPSTDIDRFFALHPGERFKLVEKLTAGKDPFAAATKGNLTASIAERGSVEPAKTYDVTCKVKAKDRASPAATIKWVIDDGSLVKKGDRLVHLDDSEIRDRLRTVAVNLKAAEADLVAAAANLDLAKNDVDTTVRLAEIDVKLAQVDLEEGLIATKEKLALKVEQAKLKLEQARSRGKARVQQAEAATRAKAAVAEQEAARKADADAELKECVLLAPADGIVYHPTPPSGRFGAAVAPVEPGTQVREGQAVVRVADLKNFVLATRVHESVVSTLRPGQEAEVRIDAFPDMRFKGKVTQISPTAAAADWRAADVKVYPVTVAIENPPAPLKPFMSGDVRIVTGERKGVIQVPVKAVVWAGRDRVCFVKTGQEVVERKVLPGSVGATAVEIREGLKEGDVVLADPAGLLGRPDTAKGGR